MGENLHENTIKIVLIHNELKILINQIIGVIGTAPKEESISCATHQLPVI